MTFAIHPYYRQTQTDSDSDQPLPTALVWSTVTSGPARQFIDEWARLSYRPSVLRRVNAWDFLPRPVADLDDLLTVCGFGTPFDDEAGDLVLWHMTRLAEHDDLAARVCLHRIMPAVMSVARRRGRITPGGVENAIGDAISTAWMVIREFPYDRRHVKIAANLVRDVEYYGFVRDQRLRRVSETQVGSETLQQIEEGNIDFFLLKDYSADFVNAGNNTKIMEAINRLRDPVQQMNETERKNVVKYLQNLSKLAALHFASTA
jgi:hypothetical protein